MAAGNESITESACRFCGNSVPHGTAFCSRCGGAVGLTETTDDPLLANLQSLFGRELEFERALGRGAMGAVYLALDPALQRRVAVKTLLPEAQDDPTGLARFLREARTAASLNHDHVVSVYAVRSNETVSAIVMQYVEGRSLDAVLRDSPLLALPVVGHIMQHTAAALQHAHDRGVVHRDVKPANVLIEHTGRAVVSDFGLARQFDATRLTDSGVIAGTVAYMSPEQCAGGSASPASDQYALGVLAFELLSGSRPFSGSLAEVLRAHIEVPPPLARLRSGTPRGVAAAVERMLRKNPAERFSNLREIEAQFGSLVHDSRATTAVVAQYSRAIPRPVRPSTPTSTTEVVPLPPPAKQRATRRVAFAAAGLAVAATIGVFAVVGRDDGVISPPPEPGATVTSGDAGTSSAPTPTPPAASRPPVDNAQRPNAGPLTSSARPDSPAVAAIVNSATPRNETAAATTKPDSPSVRVDSGAAARTPPISNPVAPAPPPAPVSRAASPADARTIATDFARLLNLRSSRDIARLGTIRGDTVFRAELLRLAQRANDFAVGFERMPSSPEVSGDLFITECTLALEWRGGRRMVIAELQAEFRDGAWHLSAFRLEPLPTPSQP